MTASERNLTPKQEQALLALMSETSIAAAATKAGVSEATLHRWLKQEHFHAEFRALRREAVERATALLQQAAWAASSTLIRLLGSPSDSVKLRAAQAILDQANRGLETLDFLERLEAVEQFAREQGGQS